MKTVNDNLISLDLNKWLKIIFKFCPNVVLYFSDNQHILHLFVYSNSKNQFSLFHYVIENKQQLKEYHTLSSFVIHNLFSSFNYFWVRCKLYFLTLLCYCNSCFHWEIFNYLTWNSIYGIQLENKMNK